MTEGVNTGVGAELRQAREAQGMTIDDVALQLKYAPRQIESLENERFERLPGPTIARGMVRNYARLLKLDPEALLVRMAAGAGRPPPGRAAPAALGEPVAFSDGTRRSTLVYTALSIAILALVGALVYGWQLETAQPEFVTPLPVEADAGGRAPPEPQPIAAAPPEPAEPVAPPVEPKAEPKDKDAATPEQPVAVAPTARKEEKRELPPGMRRLVLRAEEDSWTEVRDATGRQLLYALTPAGTERVLQGRAPFELVIGNARHVRLYLDDKPVDLKPHARGDVARMTLK